MVGRLGWDSPSVGARQPPSADTRRGAFCRIKVDDPRVVQRCRGWGDRAGSGVAPTGAGNQGHDLPRVIGASRGTVERPVACSAKFVAAEAYFERYGVPPLDEVDQGCVDNAPDRLDGLRRVRAVVVREVVERSRGDTGWKRAWLRDGARGRASRCWLSSAATHRSEHARRYAHYSSKRCALRLAIRRNRRELR